MYQFDVHRPSTVAAALAALKGSEEGKLLAGGHTLIPTMKQRLTAPRDIIDLGRVAELKGITQDDDKLVIGAMTTHNAVGRSPLVQSAIPGLADLAMMIGDPQVRNRGTIGGSIANSDPAADYPAALVALGATVKTDRREIAAEDFFTGLFETALEEDELILAVAFPKPVKSGYAKFRNPASRYAIVGVMVAQLAGGDIKVAVTGAGPSVFRVPEFENALAADFSPQALEGRVVPADGLNSDIHASADYRAHLVGVMARRAVAAAH